MRVVIVSGSSMLPTLRPGEFLLVRPHGRVRPGGLVVARFTARPGLLVVKRAVRPEAQGWWVEGDNAAATDDSRTYGAADVVATVVLRYWPPSRAGRVPRRES